MAEALIDSRPMGELRSYKQDANTINRGEIVVINAAGFAEAATDAADKYVVGVAVETNVCSSQGAERITVQVGAMLLTATSITQAMAGQSMFAVNANTVDDTAGSTNKVRVGKLLEWVTNTSGWVLIEGNMPKAGITSTDPSALVNLPPGLVVAVDATALAAAASTQVAAADATALVAAASTQTAAVDAVATAVADATSPANVAYQQAEATAVADLANDLKAKYNAAVTLLNEVKADYNAAQLEIVELRATVGQLVTLANENKADYNAAQLEIVELRATVGQLVTLANEMKGNHATLKDWAAEISTQGDTSAAMLAEIHSKDLIG